MTMPDAHDVVDDTRDLTYEYRMTVDDDVGGGNRKLSDGMCMTGHDDQDGHDDNRYGTGHSYDRCKR